MKQFETKSCTHKHFFCLFMSPDWQLYLSYFVHVNSREVSKEARDCELHHFVKNSQKLNYFRVKRASQNSFIFQKDTKAEQLGYSSLFKTSLMLKITLVMSMNWISTTLCYYGLTMHSVNLSDNIYTDFVLSAAIEIPSIIFCWLVST